MNKSLLINNLLSIKTVPLAFMGRGTVFIFVPLVPLEKQASANFRGTCRVPKKTKGIPMTAAAQLSLISPRDMSAHFVRSFMQFDGKRIAVDKRAIGLIKEEDRGKLSISMKLAGVRAATVAANFGDVFEWWMASPPKVEEVPDADER